MKTLLLKRIAELNNGTFGVLINESGRPWMLTCERPWLNNQHGVSCIPTGTYLCKRTATEKHGIAFQVMSVPNRDAILFHAGNTIADSEGCILLGRSYGMINNIPAVLNSQDAFKEFMATLSEDSFTLRIVEV